MCLCFEWVDCDWVSGWVSEWVSEFGGWVVSDVSVASVGVSEWVFIQKTNQKKMFCMFFFVDILFMFVSISSWWKATLFLFFFFFFFVCVNLFLPLKGSLVFFPYFFCLCSQKVKIIKANPCQVYIFFIIDFPHASTTSTGRRGGKTNLIINLFANKEIKQTQNKTNQYTKNSKCT